MDNNNMKESQDRMLWAATIILGVLLVFCIYMISAARDAATQSIIVTIVGGTIGLGFMNLIKVMMQRLTVDKVKEDTAKTTQVNDKMDTLQVSADKIEHQTNGGLTSRIEEAVAAALLKKDLASKKIETDAATAALIVKSVAADTAAELKKETP